MLVGDSIFCFFAVMSEVMLLLLLWKASGLGRLRFSSSEFNTMTLPAIDGNSDDDSVKFSLFAIISLHTTI